MFLKSLREKNAALNKTYTFIREMPLYILICINALKMLIVFVLKPTSLYKYSLRNLLPNREMLDIEGKDYISIYSPKVACNFDYFYENTNLIIPGYRKKINDFHNNIFLNYRVSKNNLNFKFITADSSWYEYYISKGVEVIYVSLIFINSFGSKKKMNPLPLKYKNNKQISLALTSDVDIDSYPMGSAVLSIISLSLLSKKLTVKGWNCYFNKELSKLNKFQILTGLFFGQNDRSRFSSIIESRLINLFIAQKMQNTKNLKFISNLNYFKNKKLDKFFTPRLNKIFLSEN